VEDIQPKDFSIVASRDSFHIFYIRQDMNLSFDATSKTLGHQRSRDLNTWLLVDKAAVRARPGRWDGAHVWAPSILKKPADITYYMFYTGVDAAGGQRIGVATSMNLNVWNQDTTQIYWQKKVPWTVQDSTSSDGQQFRDPFVMPHPDSAGKYLMYFSTVSEDRRPRYVVGFATSDGDLRVWRNPLPLWNTDFIHSGARIVESPHAFADPGGRWWLPYTGYNLAPTQDSAFVSFQTNDVSPIDRDTTRWSAPDTLYKYLGGDQTLQYWHASEYYRWGPGYEYLLAFNDNQRSIDIAQVSWRGPHTFVLTDSCPPHEALAVDPEVRDSHAALHLLGSHPARGPIGFRLDIPSRTGVRLAILDVAGRHVRTLLDEEVVAGEREVRWDGRNEEGKAVGGGIYFARLTTGSGQRVARVVLLP
jgi:glycosyl hydrolase family 43/flagellar hook capping protein FlgD